MENNHLLSLMELTNLPIEEAKTILTAAGNNIEAAIQIYYDSQPNENSDDPELPDEEEIRAPLPREFSQLVEEDSVRNIQLNRVKRQYASSFRDLKKETEIQEDLAQGVVPKKKSLEDLYRNPIDITSNMDLYTAKVFGQRQGKWIALLINDENFPSLSFNRDIFNTDRKQKVKQLIKKNFIFLRKNSNSEESVRILQNYKLSEQEIPVFMIIDSWTGELKKNFGDTKNLTLKNVVREMKKYTSSEDKELKYSSDGIEDTDDDDDYIVPHCSARTSAFTSTSQTSTATSSYSSQKPKAINDSDSEESFASLHSDDVDDQSDDFDETVENTGVLVEENGNK